MFGYIKVFENQLRVGDLRAYRGVYCSMCRRIACYSQPARLMLSFDMVFLALLSEYEEIKAYQQMGKGGCLKKYHEASASLDYWACVSVMLIYQKIRNDVQDGALRKRITLAALQKGYDRCLERYPETEKCIREALKTIDNVEAQRCDDPAVPAHIFADMLVHVYDSCPGCLTEPVVHRHLCRIVKELALWVYCIDFYDDAVKDEKEGQYNPLLIRAQQRNCSLQEVLDDFRPVIDRHVEELNRLCDYLPYGGFHPVITNVLHDGIMAVTAKVVLKTSEDHP